MNNLLRGHKILLRALEPDDVEILYTWENDTDVWRISSVAAPYSRYVLRQLVENQRHDIYETKQLRLVIAALDDGRPVGCIDLFDFDPYNKRAGIGILVYKEEDRGLGYATEAIMLLKRYGFGVLRLHQLYANVEAGNQASLALFRRQGFTDAGIKREWLVTDEGFCDEYILQLINPEK